MYERERCEHCLFELASRFLTSEPIVNAFRKRDAEIDASLIDYNAAKRSKALIDLHQENKTARRNTADKKKDRKKDKKKREKDKKKKKDKKSRSKKKKKDDNRQEVCTIFLFITLEFMHVGVLLWPFLQIAVSKQCFGIE